MVRGFYTAGSGILASSRKLDVVAGNMANSGTAGYKQNVAVTSAFQENLVVKVDKLSKQQMMQLGSINKGQAIDSIAVSYEQGSVQMTGNPFDLAISGEGFFTIQDTDNTILYTRNGQFGLDEEGFIVNSSGVRLMGENGPINTGGKLFEISPDGNIFTEGVLIDHLALYNPVNTDTMVKHREGYFFDTAVTAQKPFSGRISQGYVEASNVNMVDEMMEMMKSQRSLQSCSQAVKMIDETLEKAVEIGRMA